MRNLKVLHNSSLAVQLLSAIEAAKHCIVHDGQAHMDDLIFTKIVQHINPDVQVERLNIRATPERIKEIYGEGKAIVGDMTRQYAPFELLFDHHQDRRLPSSHELLLQSLNAEFKKDEAQERSEWISKVDTGQIVYREYRLPENIAEMIRAIDTQDQLSFDMAADALWYWLFTGDVEEGFRNIAQNAWREADAAAELLWSKHVDISSNGYVVSRHRGFIAGWQTRLLGNQHFMIAPSTRTEGQFVLLSENSAKHPINADAYPYFASKTTFLHNNLFTATLDTLDDAIALAKKSL